MERPFIIKRQHSGRKFGRDWNPAGNASTTERNMGIAPADCIALRAALTGKPLESLTRFSLISKR